MTNAFTIPRRAFTEAELRALRKSQAGHRGGQTRHRESGGQVYTTTNPRARRAKSK